jgi:spore germination cell wall hydrolase CwlJ-like protein
MIVDPRIPMMAQGLDLGAVQRNAFQAAQMRAAERGIDQENALAAALRQDGAGLFAPDPTARMASAQRLLQVGGARAFPLVAPIVESARQEQEFNAIRQRFGGGGGAPAAMHGGAPRPQAAAPQASATPAAGGDDLDIAARVLVGEAGGEGPEGMAAAAAVMANRARLQGRSLREVVTAPGQFEAWGSRQRELMALPPERVAEARRILEGVLSGGTPDPTNGATHFLNPDLQRQMGRNQPAWAPEGQGTRIGRHVFYARPGDFRRAGGDDVIPASAPGSEGTAPRMPGQPTPQQFAELVEMAGSPNPRVAQWARAQVQAWAPFMRQDDPGRYRDDAVEIDGRQVRGQRNSRTNQFTAFPGQTERQDPGVTPARAASMIEELAPAVANGTATEQQARRYLNAVNVYQNRISENGTLVSQPLPPYAPPMDWVTRRYGIQFTPQPETPAATGSPAGPTDAAAATVQLPAGPAPAGMPGQAGGVTPPPGPRMEGGTRRQIEERQFNTSEQASRLDEISRTFRPEYQRFDTRWSNMWSSLRERGGARLGAQEQQQLRAYTQARAAALTNLNSTIQEITGAAMGVEEARRIIATMPNPGTGLFDGDSPTEFRAKLDRATEAARNALIRYNWALRRGVNPLESGVALEDVPRIVRSRGREIETELREANPNIGRDELQQQTLARLRQELGVR